MTKRIYITALALTLLMGSSLFLSTGNAQTRKRANAKTTQDAGDPLMSLPESDGVASIDVQRLLNEFLPSVLSSDPAKLADVNRRIDDVKSRTGIDVRAFERVAVGMRFVNPTPNTIKAESVALARGRFNAPVMLTAALLVTKDKYKYQEQKHGGKSIYVFNGAELFGNDKLGVADEVSRKTGSKVAKAVADLFEKLLNFRSGEVAVAAIDENTLAIGQPQHVRAAIDAAGSRARRNVALTQMATRNANAVVGFGANMPANVSRYFAIDNDDMSKNVNAIRQLYGSVAATSGGFELQTFARTETPVQAQGVHDMIAGLRDLGGFLIASMSGEKGKLAKTALENVKITKEANEVLIRLEMAQSDVAMLMRVF